MNLSLYFHISRLKKNKRTGHTRNCLLYKQSGTAVTKGCSYKKRTLVKTLAAAPTPFSTDIYPYVFSLIFLLGHFQRYECCIYTKTDVTNDPSMCLACP